MSAAAAKDPWPLLMARKHEVSELMTKGVERNLVRHGIERIRGRARFRSCREIEVAQAGMNVEILTRTSIEGGTERQSSFLQEAVARCAASPPAPPPK